MNTVVAFNVEKGGIEIRFPERPAQSVIDSLKADRFRWSKFSKCWWIKDSPAARAAAANYGTLPEDAPEFDDGTAAYINAHERASVERGGENYAWGG